VSTPTLPLRLNDSFVAEAWIATIPDIAAVGGAAMVGSELPPAALPDSNKPAPWVSTGFIMTTVYGGTPDPMLPIHKPVMQVDCFATVPGSNDPPWEDAEALAQAVQYACWQWNTTARPVPVCVNGVTYPTAIVLSAWVIRTFQRMYSDAADYARIQGDVQLIWKTANEIFYA
jgi:hypothetical protein